jgi:hypothetical protein
MLSLTIRSKCFEAVAGRNAKVSQRSRLIQKTQFPQSDILEMSAGNFRRRRPDQINSVSESAKP